MEGEAMSCATYHIMISRLVDGELDLQSYQALREHLNTCSECSDLHERMIALNEGVRAIAHTSPDSTLAAKVKDRMAAARHDDRARWLVPFWGQAAAFGIVVLVALGIGNLAGRSLIETMLNHHQAQSGIELLVMENDQSFSDTIMTLGGEENSR
jgi:anti-sigma factor RsiW